MSRKARLYCPHCGARIGKRREEDVLRDHCPRCDTFFYDNPLPVVSTIVAVERTVLLVRRGRAPYAGMWCLPTGFAESGESIEGAALRELEEEAGVKGRVTSLVDVDSQTSRFYGDLLFVTFEVEPAGGSVEPGSDTVEARFFPVSALPRLAFPSNRKAIAAYVRGKQDFWKIEDSFAATMGEGRRAGAGGPRVSDRLVVVIEKSAHAIADRWIRDVVSNPTTPSFARAPQAELRRRILRVIANFGRWLGGFHGDRDVREFFVGLGTMRAVQGFGLEELLSALSLLKKHIWEYALGQGMWRKVIDIYAALELDRRIVVFFDKAAFHMTRGYVQARGIDAGRRASRAGRRRPKLTAGGAGTRSRR